MVAPGGRQPPELADEARSALDGRAHACDRVTLAASRQNVRINTSFASFCRSHH
jgi:hypothetical protein